MAVSYTHLDVYKRQREDLSLLEKYHEGIIALSACLAGEVARFLTRGMYEDAKKAALRYQDIFGKGNFFLELQDHGIPEQQNVNQQLLKMHRETGIELVATNDVHYTLAEDAQPHDVLLCLQTGKKLTDEDRMRYEGGQYYVCLLYTSIREKLWKEAFWSQSFCLLTAGGAPVEVIRQYIETQGEKKH